MSVITNFDSNYFNSVDILQAQAYILTVYKLQATVSKSQVTLRLKYTPFNINLTKLIFTELKVTTNTITTKSSGKYKYIHITFESKIFAQSLEGFNLTKLHHNLHPHILRAIVELKFKLNKTSLQATVSNSYLTWLTAYIIYHPLNTHNITSLHIRTTKAQTCIRFKLYPNDHTLINYIYPSDHTTGYIHDPTMLNAIK